MIRAVVDTSVLVSAFIGSPENAPALIVQRIREDRLILVASPLLIAELDGVLARPKFDRWAAHGRGSAYVAGLAAVAEMHQDPDHAPAVTADPKDDFLVALALSADADLLTSLDRHLLDAATELLVVTPTQLLDRLS